MDGCKIYPGEDTAPVLLNIKYSLSRDQEAVEIQKHFRRDTTVGEMKVCVMLMTSLISFTVHTNETKTINDVMYTSVLQQILSKNQS